MADTKNTGLAELAAVPADDDLLYLVDVSDTSMAPTGTSKKNQAKYVLRTNGTANTLGANIAANNYNFTGAGTVGAGAILAANYYGGTASGGTATISSTTHATKGKILFGAASAFDETNNALGLNTLSPDGLQVSCAVAETARGVDNVRMGVVAGAPRIVLEDAGATQWQIDNVSGVLRFFVPGTVYGQFSTNGFLSTASLFAGGITFNGEDGIRLVSSSGYGYIDIKGANDLIFRLDNTNGSTERMRLTGSGNLSLQGNLSVVGNCDPGSLGGSWTGLNFISGWGNLGGGWQAGQYKKIGDLVFLRGFVVRTSGSSAYIATLPSGYRPPAPDRWAVTTDSGAHANVQIDSNGDMQVITGDPTAYMTLSGIVFSTV